MGIFDKLMDTMHLGNDYEDDYDDYDDDFDDEPESRGSLFKKKDKKYDYDLGDDRASGSEKVKSGKTAAGADHAYAFKKRSSRYGSLCIQTNSV